MILAQAYIVGLAAYYVFISINIGCWVSNSKYAHIFYINDHKKHTKRVEIHYYS